MASTDGAAGGDTQGGGGGPLLGQPSGDRARAVPAAAPAAARAAGKRKRGRPRADREGGAVRGSRGSAPAADGAEQRTIPLSRVEFITHQTWPGERGNRGSFYLQVDHEDVVALQLRLTLGQPMIWCRHKGSEAEYPLTTVAKLVRADGV